MTANELPQDCVLALCNIEICAVDSGTGYEMRFLIGALGEAEPVWGPWVYVARELADRMFPWAQQFIARKALSMRPAALH